MKWLKVGLMFLWVIHWNFTKTTQYGQEFGQRKKYFDTNLEMCTFLAQMPQDDVLDNGAVVHISRVKIYQLGE
jgi:hypothetical protein